MSKKVSFSYFIDMLKAFVGSEMNRRINCH